MNLNGVSSDERLFGLAEVGDMGVCGWRGTARIETASETAEVEGDLEEAGQLGEGGHGVGAQPLVASQSQTAEGHPEIPASQLPFNGAAGPGSGQRGYVIIRHPGALVGISGWAIDFVQKGLPGCHPAAALVPFPGFAVYDGGVEEAGSKFGEAAVAADGATEGG